MDEEQPPVPAVAWDDSLQEAPAVDPEQLRLALEQAHADRQQRLSGIMQQIRRLSSEKNKRKEDLAALDLEPVVLGCAVPEIPPQDFADGEHPALDEQEAYEQEAAGLPQAIPEEGMIVGHAAPEFEQENAPVLPQGPMRTDEEHRRRIERQRKAYQCHQDRLKALNARQRRQRRTKPLTMRERYDLAVLRQRAINDLTELGKQAAEKAILREVERQERLERMGAAERRAQLRPEDRPAAPFESYAADVRMLTTPREPNFQPLRRRQRQHWARKDTNAFYGCCQSWHWNS